MVNTVKRFIQKVLTNWGYILVFSLATVLRLVMFSQVGKDYDTFLTTVNIFLNGQNPYYETLRSFSDPDLTSGGYAYLPGLLYSFYSLYVVSFITHIPYEILWKIPNLLAELGVGILLVKLLQSKGKLVTICGLMVWLFNPYILSQQRYTYTDAIPVFFMLFSLYKLGKDDVLAGSFFGLAVVFKTFPIFAFPIFLLFSKDKLKFLVSGTLVGIAFSIPFMRSLSDFTTYIKGSLFVHEGRTITGRPFLFYISYMYHIELFQIIPVKYYTYASILSAWFFPLILYFWRKIKNPYVLSTIALACFYLFTPVFNRTYVIWFLPILIVSLAQLKKPAYYISVVSFYIFYYWYLIQWSDGFHITKPI